MFPFSRMRHMFVWAYRHRFIRLQPKSWGPKELWCLSVCHSFLVRVRTFERKAIETYRLKWKVSVCRCTFWWFRPKSANGSWPNLAEMSKNSGLRNMSLNEQELWNGRSQFRPPERWLNLAKQNWPKSFFFRWSYTKYSICKKGLYH